MLFKSISATVPSEIEFTNQTMYTVEVYWVDYQGELQLYQTLPPGNVYIQRTYETHPWVVKDKETGREIAYITATGERQTLALKDEIVHLLSHNEDLREITHFLAQGDVSNVQAGWHDFVQKEYADTLKQDWQADIDSVIRWVLRETYTRSTQNLNFGAIRIRFYTNMKAQIRDEIATARQYLLTQPTSDDAIVVGAYRSSTGNSGPIKFPSDLTTDPRTGEPLPSRPTPDSNRSFRTKQDVEEYVSSLTEMLKSINDNSQRAQIDLQIAISEHEQMLQSMPNISQSLHSTAKTIIDKTG